jgi:DNA processing protein
VTGTASGAEDRSSPGGPAAGDGRTAPGVAPSGRGTRSGTPAACDDCLRRADLVAAVAGLLDIEWRRRSAPARVLSLPDAALAALDPSGGVARRDADFSPARARRIVADAGLTAACRCAPAYPDTLRALADPPAVLHIAGRPEALAVEPAVAVVGARRGTAYGLEVARGLGGSLTAAGVPVVSGLAIGVDSAAHVGALGRRGAAPVAVLAGGADVPYPPSKRRLYSAIVARGCVVSELPPKFTAYRWCFVARNRLIAGLAELTVVVEAAERSGSLTTADFAEQLGRPVGAVPGPVTSRYSSGTNLLLAAGAAVVRDARDVLDQILGPGHELTPMPATAADPLEPHLRRLLDAIERGHGSLAELAPEPSAAPAVLQALTELELRGLVRREFGGRYVRSLEPRR